jgi:hypothetical protein
LEEAMPGNGKVFISHSHADNDRIRPLLDYFDLTGVDYWVDLNDLAVGALISQQIQEAIASRDVFIKICTLAAQQRSFWLDQEFGAFQALQAEEQGTGKVIERRFLPVVLDREYQCQPFERTVKYITTYGKATSDWLAEIGRALGISYDPASIDQTNTTNDQPNGLSEALAEIDVALQDEIRANRTSPKGHKATDGRLAGRLGDQFLYIFALDDPWEPQGASLTVHSFKSRPSVVTVVSCSGVTITVATTAQLPDQALHDITFYEDPIALLEALRTALQRSDESPILLGTKSLGLLSTARGRAPIPMSIPGYHPTDSQRMAIELALGSDLSFIIGPPGTGKTATLAAIAYFHLLAGRSVLIAAHTNIAIDNAILKLAELAAGRPELESGQIIRLGAPKSTEVCTHEYVYPPNIVRREGKDLERQKRVIQQKLQEHERWLADAQQRLHGLHESSTHDIAQLQAAATARKHDFDTLKRQQVMFKHSCKLKLAECREQQQFAEQDLVSVQSHLAHLTEQRVRLSTVQEACRTRAATLTTQLQSTHDTPAVTRAIRAMSRKRNIRELADIEYRLRVAQDHFHRVEGDIAAAQKRRAAAERTINDLTLAHTRLVEMANSSPYGEALITAQRSLEDLKGTMSQRTTEYDRQRRRLESLCAGAQREVENAVSQISALDQELSNLEKELVSKARIIGTTLTKTYMHSALKERRFDVVIMDEASIAPIPAAFLAASRADLQVTILGDPYQLSPIARAQSDMAKKWLRRDIFELAGVTLERAGVENSRCAFLSEQFRMQPEISSIPRKHIYEGRLRDGETLPPPKRIDPQPEARLLLCDTSDENPLATYANSNGSRVNTYHQRCSIEIASQALQSLGWEQRADDEPPVAIVTPFRQQALAIQRELRARKLDRLIRAGTIHGFQGLEFDVVVYDTVDSCPLEPSAYMTKGGRWSQAMRLVNVAVTRAKYKLVIVANLAYMQRHLSNRDILWLAIDQAKQTSVIESQRLWSAG